MPGMEVGCAAWLIATVSLSFLSSRPLAQNCLAVGCRSGVIVWEVDPQVMRYLFVNMLPCLLPHAGLGRVLKKITSTDTHTRTGN